MERTPTCSAPTHRLSLSPRIVIKSSHAKWKHMFHGHLKHLKLYMIYIFEDYTSYNANRNVCFVSPFSFVLVSLNMCIKVTLFLQETRKKLNILAEVNGQT